jgi:hypothetical protein
MVYGRMAGHLTREGSARGPGAAREPARPSSSGDAGFRDWRKEEEEEEGEKNSQTGGHANSHAAPIAGGGWGGGGENKNKNTTSQPPERACERLGSAYHWAPGAGPVSS